MSGSSNLDSFRNGRQVAVELVSCGVLPPGLVQYYLQHSITVEKLQILHQTRKYLRLLKIAVIGKSTCL